MSLKTLLNKICLIQVKNQAQGSMGQVTETWQTGYADVPIMIQPNKEPVVLENGYQVTIKDFVAYFLPGQHVNEKHRIVIGEDMYEVLAVIGDSRSTYKKAFLEQVTFTPILTVPHKKELAMTYRIVGQ